MGTVKKDIRTGREYISRFVIFNEESQKVVQYKRGDKMKHRQWVTKELAKQWAAENMNSWVVMEQWQWIDDLPAYREIWTTQKLH